jgi:hypothetical protein
MEARM